MNKAELIQKLESKPIIINIGDLTEEETSDGIKTYTCQIKQTDLYSENTLKNRTITIYVKDEGKGVSERAFTEQNLINSPSRNVLDYLQENFINYRFSGSFEKDCVYDVEVTTKNPETGKFEKCSIMVCEDENGVTHGKLI